MRVMLILCAAALTAACSAPDGGDSDKASPMPGDRRAGTPAETAPTGDQNRDMARVDSMKAAARALANTGGCESTGQCASIAMGARACGGPSEYIVYCALTTDTAALQRAVDDVERAERAYNASHGIISTCEMLLAPRVELAGGVCRVAGSTGR